MFFVLVFFVLLFFSERQRTYLAPGTPHVLFDQTCLAQREIKVYVAGGRAVAAPHALAHTHARPCAERFTLTDVQTFPLRDKATAPHAEGMVAIVTEQALGINLIPPRRTVTLLKTC